MDSERISSILSDIAAMLMDCIEAALRPLLRSIIAGRLAAGLSLEESIPVFVSTDVFGRHRLKLRGLLHEVTQQVRLQPEGMTPRGSVERVQAAPADQHPSDLLTCVAGEPRHTGANESDQVPPPKKTASPGRPWNQARSSAHCRARARPDGEARTG